MSHTLLTTSSAIRGIVGTFLVQGPWFWEPWEKFEIYRHFPDMPDVLGTVMWIREERAFPEQVIPDRIVSFSLEYSRPRRHVLAPVSSPAPPPKR